MTVTLKVEGPMMATRERGRQRAEAMIEAAAGRFLRCDFSEVEAATVGSLDEFRQTLIEAGQQHAFVNANEFVGETLARVIQRRADSGMPESGKPDRTVLCGPDAIEPDLP